MVFIQPTVTLRGWILDIKLKCTLYKAHKYFCYIQKQLHFKWLSSKWFHLFSFEWKWRGIVCQNIQIQLIQRFFLSPNITLNTRPSQILWTSISNRYRKLNLEFWPEFQLLSAYRLNIQSFENCHKIWKWREGSIDFYSYSWISHNSFRF